MFVSYEMLKVMKNFLKSMLLNVISYRYQEKYLKKVDRQKADRSGRNNSFAAVKASRY